MSRQMELLVKEYIDNKTLALRFSIEARSSTYISEKFVVAGMVECMFRADVSYGSKNEDMPRNVAIYEKFKLIHNGFAVCYGVHLVTQKDEDGTVINTLKVVSHDEINIRDNVWHFIGQAIVDDGRVYYCFKFRILIQDPVHIHSTTLITKIHADTALTDFEICGEDGSINAHKAILATASPVLMILFTEDWEENLSGKLDLPGINVDTLNDFKDYIYLRVLPDFGEETDQIYRRLEELLKLACYLMMPDLIHLCTFKFLLMLTDNNAFKLLNLAVTYKLKNLFAGIILSHDHKSINLGRLADSGIDWN